ncbi:MAG: hypothetical protein HQK54_01120 [Oligoflexales bacterium]|nr:hypothetical protein [Oligoflexales bacterium]
MISKKTSLKKPAPEKKSRLRTYSILIIASAILSLFSASPISAEQKTFEPIFKVEDRCPKIPLLEKSLVDPFIMNLAEDAGNNIGKILEKIEILRQKLSDIKETQERLSALQEIYQNYVIVSYYLSSVMPQEEKDRGGVQPPEDLTQENIRQLIVKYGTQFSEISELNDDRLRADYHIITSNVLLGKEIKESLQKLKKLQIKMIPALKPKVDLLIALLQTHEYGSIENLGELEKTALDTNDNDKIVIGLYIAKAVSENSLKSQQTDKHERDLIRKKLLLATKKAEKLPSENKKEILQCAISFWRNDMGDTGSWLSPPIDGSAFVEYDEIFDAFTEREALLEYKRGNLKKAISLYQSIADNYDGLIRYKIDKRTVDIEFQLLKNRNDYKTILATLKNLENSYGEKDFLGESSEDLRERSLNWFRVARKNMIYKLVSYAFKKETPMEQRRVAIEILMDYKSKLENPDEKQKIGGYMARLHFLNNQLQASIDEYMKLAAASADANSKNKHISNAVKIQSIIAKWPFNPPWKNLAPEKEEERRALIDLYQKLLSNDEKNWSAIAQTGLLMINLNQKEKAFRFWTGKISGGEGSDSIISQKIAGIMLNEYNQEKKWSKSVALLEICFSKKITPVYENSEMKIDSLMSDSLYNLIKEEQANGESSQLVKLLKKYIKIAPRGRQSCEIRLLLAKKEYSTGDEDNASKIILQIIQEKPPWPEYEQALLLGIEWFKKKNQNLAINLSLQYLKNFKDKNSAVGIRDNLANLYLEKQWFGDAAKIYKMQAMAQNVPRPKKAEAALAYMKLEEKEGDPNLARWGALTVLKISRDENQIAEALAFETRYAAASNDYPTLDKIKNRLKTMENNKEAKRTLAFIQSIMAQKVSNQILVASSDKSGIQFKKKINQYYSIFLRKKEWQKNICKIEGESSAECKKSRTALARTGREIIKKLKEIQMSNQVPDDRQYSAYLSEIIKNVEKISFSDKIR